MLKLFTFMVMGLHLKLMLNGENMALHKILYIVGVFIIIFLLAIRLFYTKASNSVYFSYTGNFDDALYLEADDSMFVAPYILDFKTFDKITLGVRINRVNWRCVSVEGITRHGYALEDEVLYFYANASENKYIEFENQASLDEFILNKGGSESYTLDIQKLDSIKKKYKGHRYIKLFVKNLNCDGKLTFE